MSPLQANLFFRYAMAKWLELIHPAVEFVNYADDAILRYQKKQLLFICSL
ncbi:hypothetical protein GM418_03315 [Maribellus comscasis]|uniref:Uncharacterized protein n=1 Tax=Maribellus comscasis TaxID=2681766 RepID=A0A6I6JYE5_9BACT|nr:hypothetical protein GM418_03315 [Maribellus comscasis]